MSREPYGKSPSPRSSAWHRMGVENRYLRAEFSTGIPWRKQDFCRGVLAAGSEHRRVPESGAQLIPIFTIERYGFSGYSFSRQVEIQRLRWWATARVRIAHHNRDRSPQARRQAARVSDEASAVGWLTAGDPRRLSPRPAGEDTMEERPRRVGIGTVERGTSARSCSNRQTPEETQSFLDATVAAARAGWRQLLICICTPSRSCGRALRVLRLPGHRAEADARSRSWQTPELRSRTSTTDAPHLRGVELKGVPGQARHHLADLAARSCRPRMLGVRPPSPASWIGYAPLRGCLVHPSRK